VHINYVVNRQLYSPWVDGSDVIQTNVQKVSHGLGKINVMSINYTILTKCARKHFYSASAISA